MYQRKPRSHHKLKLALRKLVLRLEGLGTTALAVGSTRASLSDTRARIFAKRCPKTNYGGTWRKKLAMIEATLFEAATYGIPYSRTKSTSATSKHIGHPNITGRTHCIERSRLCTRGIQSNASYVSPWFFLVWSCPQSVTESLLCDFAGIQNRADGASINTS